MKNPITPPGIELVTCSSVSRPAAFCTFVLYTMLRNWKLKRIFFLVESKVDCEHYMAHILCEIKVVSTRVGTLIVATIYLELMQNRYMFRSFTVLQCSHQHCVQPVASDVEVVGYL